MKYYEIAYGWIKFGMIPLKQWIGLREHLQENTLSSGKTHAFQFQFFPWKPIHWLKQTMIKWRFPEMGLPPSFHPILVGVSRTQKPSRLSGTPMTMETAKFILKVSRTDQVPLLGIGDQECADPGDAFSTRKATKTGRWTTENWIWGNHLIQYDNTIWKYDNITIW